MDPEGESSQDLIQYYQKLKKDVDWLKEKLQTKYGMPPSYDLLASLPLEYKVAHDELESADLNDNSVQVANSWLSPNPLHPRFSTSPGEEKTHIIMKTEAYIFIQKFFGKNSASMKFPQTHYLLYGPIGIGKSFGLALNVLQLRKRKEFLVFYVNNPLYFNLKYFIKELQYMLQFADTAILSDCQKFHDLLCNAFNLNHYLSFTEIWAQLQVKLFEEKEDYMKCKVILQSIQDIFKKPVLVIVDQAPLKEDSIREFAYGFVHHMSKGLSPDYALILCSSRHPPLNLTGAFKKVKIESRFSSKEAETFIAARLRNDLISKEYDPKNVVIKTLLNTLLNIPFELAIFCQISHEFPEEGLDALTARYFERRREDILGIVMLFDQDRQKTQWIEYLTLTHLDLPIPDPKESIIDQNLCSFYGYNTSRSCAYLEFHHPLYKNCVELYYMKEIAAQVAQFLSPLQVPEFMRKLNLKPASHGDILEKYCHILLCNHYHFGENQPWEFSYHKHPNLGELSPRTKKFIIKDYCHLKTSGKEVGGVIEIDLGLEKLDLEHLKDFEIDESDFGGPEPTEDYFSYHGRLYIPDSDFFDLIDSVFVAEEQKTIFFMQTSLNISMHDHSTSSQMEVEKEEKKSPEIQISKESKKRDTNKKKSDVRFKEVFADTSLISDRRPQFKSFVEAMKRIKLHGYKFQWIWLGLVDGQWNTKTIGNKLKDIDEDSWVILVNENPLFANLNVLFKK